MGAKLTEETTSALVLAGYDNRKFPFMSLVVPVEEPLIKMEALGMGRPESSVIFPEIVRDCASRFALNSSNPPSRMSSFLMCLKF